MAILASLSVSEALKDPAICSRFLLTRRLSKPRSALEEEERVLFEAVDRHTTSQVKVALMIARSDSPATIALLRYGALLQSPRVVRLMQSIPLRPVTIALNTAAANSKISKKVLSHFRFTAIIWQFMSAGAVADAIPCRGVASRGEGTFASLTAFIAHTPVLFENHVRRLICCVLQGLQTLHGEGIAYRGWSTERLMLLCAGGPSLPPPSPSSISSLVNAIDESCATLKLAVSHGSCSVQGNNAAASAGSTLGFGCVRFLAPEVVDACFVPAKPVLLTRSSSPPQPPIMSSSSTASYDAPAADMWAVGVLMHLLLFGSFCIPEISSEKDKWGRLRLLRGVAQTPSFRREYDLQAANVAAQPSREAFRLLARLLDRDPKKRPTAKECLIDPWILYLSPSKGPGSGGGGSTAFVDEKASLSTTISLFQSLHCQYERERLSTTARPDCIPSQGLFSPTSDRSPFPFGANTLIRFRYERKCMECRVKPNSQLTEAWVTADRALTTIDLTCNPIGTKGLRALLDALSEGAAAGECHITALILAGCNMADQEVDMIVQTFISDRSRQQHLRHVCFDGSPLVSSGAVRRVITAQRRPGPLLTVSFRDCPGVTAKLFRVALAGGVVATC
jgi:serine/threonine protein kinase